MNWYCLIHVLCGALTIAIFLYFQLIECSQITMSDVLMAIIFSLFGPIGLIGTIIGSAIASGKSTVLYRKRDKP